MNERPTQGQLDLLTYRIVQKNVARMSHVLSARSQDWVKDDTINAIIIKANYHNITNLKFTECTKINYQLLFSAFVSPAYLQFLKRLF